MKTKRNKKYRPKAVSINPLTEVFGGMSDVHQPHLQRLLVVNSLCFQAIVQGRGTRDDWDKLVGAINIGNVMCEMGIGNEFRPAMLAAVTRFAKSESGTCAISVSSSLATN